jgi:hypothetical protein
VEKEGRNPFLRGPRTKKEGTYPDKILHPRMEDRVEICSSDPFILGWKDPTCTGMRRPCKRILSSRKGTRCEEVSFQCIDRNSLGSFGIQKRIDRCKPDPCFQVLTDQRTKVTPPNVGMASLGSTIRGTSSSAPGPLGSERTFLQGPVRSGVPLFGSRLAGKPPAVSSEICRCC